MQLNIMQGFGGFAAGGFRGGYPGGQCGNDDDGEGPAKEIAQTQGRIDLAADEGHIFGHAAELAEIHAYDTETPVEHQPQDDAGGNTHQPDHGAFQDEEQGDLARFEPHGAQQADLTCPFVNGHQQQIEDADAGDHIDDDAEDIHHRAL